MYLTSGSPAPESPRDDAADEAAEALAEGQVQDFITNQSVADSPAERTLQTVARSLVDEYLFDHTQLARDLPLVYEVIDGEGRSRKVRTRVNVGVFPEGARKTNPAHIIRVCLTQPPSTKANDPKRGVDSLEQVMGALPACDYGLWTNGTDLVFKQKLAAGRLQPEYVDLYDLPGNGETAADLDRPDRQTGRIATGDNLVRTFARVHDYIYGNQGLKKDAAFWQVLNLIFCKIHDERKPGRRRFWVKGTERNTPEGQKAIAGRIRALFDEVKADPNYASVFTDRDIIDLNDRVLAFAVGELSRYNLLDTDVDVKGAAYEEITSSMLKQQRGQFFTPTNVIRLMVQMMDPGGPDLTDRSSWPRILDPACGSGRFLTYALDHVRSKLADQLYPDEHPLLRLHHLEEEPDKGAIVRGFAEHCLYGIDFDPDLKRAARMNMILNNDGHGNILSFNSLEYPLMLGRHNVVDLQRDWEDEPLAAWPDPVRARLTADLGTFDFVFTNPPFGAKIPIDDPHILDRFDLGHRWSQDREGRFIRESSLQRSVAPEVLFVERCVEWAKPGTGKIAIVLPDGILGNPDAEYIRYWILTHCQVLASVDLPVEAFLPQVGVQASLLFLRRKSRDEMRVAAEIAEDYSVFMAIAETVGHDRRGNTVYARDPDGAEVIYSGRRDVKRRLNHRWRVVNVPFQEKRVDDDLPRIGETYGQYRVTGQALA